MLSVVVLLKCVQLYCYVDAIKSCQPSNNYDKYIAFLTISYLYCHNCVLCCVPNGLLQTIHIYVHFRSLF